MKRRSLTGRAAELVKGKAHFDGRREEMQKKFESDRLHKHRDLEALKERQFTAQQEQRLKHARERLDMMKTHRQHRDETQQQQDRDRPRLVAERQKAVERNAEIERGHKQEQTKERGRNSSGDDAAGGREKFARPLAFRRKSVQLWLHAILRWLILHAGQQEGIPPQFGAPPRQGGGLARFLAMTRNFALGTVGLAILIFIAEKIFPAPLTPST